MFGSVVQFFRSWSARRPYWASAALIGAVTLFGLVTDPVLHAANVDVVYVLAVLVSAVFWGRGPAVFTALASAGVFAYCFISPRFAFAFNDLPYVITLLAFVAIALATSALATRARELSRAQAAHALAEARSQAKDEILGKISHELRSPLNVVMGWIHLLERADGDREQLSRGLASLQQSAQLLVRLVDDLLNASRMKSGKLSVDLQPTTIAPVVARAADVVAPAAEQKNVRLQLDVSDAGDVLADQQRMEQVVTNLLLNAIKFTPPGGCVSVRLARVAKSVELAVSDTGIGIPADFLPRLFEPFTQADTRNAAQGLGLGLSIVKHLVEAHGGAIEAKSDGPGRGATFIVRLPALSPQYQRA